MFDECPVPGIDYLNFQKVENGLTKLKAKYNIRPELEILDSNEFFETVSKDYFPESNDKAKWRAIKIHERMLNTVTTAGKKVAHLVISHGFFIDTFALLYSTIEDNSDFTSQVNTFVKDYSQNELNQ